MTTASTTPTSAPEKKVDTDSEGEDDDKYSIFKTMGPAFAKGGYKSHGVPLLPWDASISVLCLTL